MADMTYNVIVDLPVVLKKLPQVKAIVVKAIANALALGINPNADFAQATKWIIAAYPNVLKATPLRNGQIMLQFVTECEVVKWKLAHG